MEREVEERFERMERNLVVVTQVLSAASKNLETMAQLMNKYIDAADARMTRMEQNLDLLIRAIATEHTNGRS